MYGVGPEKKTDQDGIDLRRFRSIIDHHSHLYPCTLQPRRDGQDCQMLFAIISAGVSRLLLILGIQPQSKAQLIERQVDPVGMNLNSCDHGAENCTQLLRIELLPGAGKPSRLVQKTLLGNRVGPMALNCVQHGDRISEPRAYPARDQSLDMRGRNALTPPRRLIASSH